MEREGGCLCGQVRFRFTGEPVATRQCWCRDCQYLAANGTVNVVIPSDTLTVTGELTSHRKTADSGNEVQRRFCPQCGTAMFSNSTGRPGLTGIRAGTLDDPSSVQPTVNIWSASAPRWACLNPAMERLDGPPPPLATSR